MKQNKITIIPRMGGKYKLLNEIVPLVVQTARDYQLTHYIEACGGGARVLLNLPINLFEYRIYNEIDEQLCSIFQIFKDKYYLTEMMSILEKYRYSKDIFIMAREELKVDKVKQHLSVLERGIYAYILLTQSRAANMQSYSPSKEYDMEYYDKISKLKDYYYLFENIEIQNRDCMLILEEYKNSEDVLIYLDPPYNPLTMKNPKTYGEYSWTLEQHQILVERLLSTRARIVLSGYEDDKQWTYKPLEDAGWLKIKLKDVHVSSGASDRKESEYIWVNFEVSPYVLQKISGK